MAEASAFRRREVSARRGPSLLRSSHTRRPFPPRATAALGLKPLAGNRIQAWSCWQRLELSGHRCRVENPAGSVTMPRPGRHELHVRRAADRRDASRPRRINYGVGIRGKCAVPRVNNSDADRTLGDHH